MMSSPFVPLAMTVSAAPSPAVPPMAPRGSTLTCVTSVPLRSLTVSVSVPPSALRSMRSTSFRSMTMLPRLRVNSTRPPFADASKISAPALPLNSIVSVPSWPSTMSLPSPGSHWNTSSPAPMNATSLPCWPSMKSLPSPPISRSSPLLPRIVSLPAPPSTVSLISAARLPVAENVSSPPFMLTTRFSVVPMSIENGAGSTRSKRTRVPLAVTVKISAPLPPLTSAVSMPAPPSMQVGVVAGIPDHAVVAGLRRTSGRRRRRRSARRCPRRRTASRRRPCRAACRCRPGRTAGRAPEPPVSDVVAGAAEQVGPGQRAVGLVERDDVVAAQAEHLDQRGVRDASALPPLIATAPPLTRILPAASRLTRSCWRCCPMTGAAEERAVTGGRQTPAARARRCEVVQRSIRRDR